MIFNAILGESGRPEYYAFTDWLFVGWNNNATIGTILSYIFYWLSVVVALVYMKWSEGRFQILGIKSAAWQRRQERKERAAAGLYTAETGEDLKKAGLAESPGTQAIAEPLYELRDDRY